MPTLRYRQDAATATVTYVMIVVVITVIVDVIVAVAAAVVFRKEWYRKTGKEVIEGRPLLHHLSGFKGRCKGCLKLIIRNYDAIVSLKSEATIVLVMQTGKQADI
jgi:hypothetical protein